MAFPGELLMFQSFLSNSRMKGDLNSHPSRFYPNVGVTRVTSLGHTLFSICINDALDDISSHLGIYAEGTTIYSSLDSKSEYLDKN